MSLYIASLNSGSNGNCYYIGNQHEAVLIDAGISCRETEKRVTRLGLSMAKIKAIFVTHEHTDHIRGVAFISRKHKIPVYISAATNMDSRLSLDTDLVKNLSAYNPVKIGSLTIKAFPKQHDASEPHSFIVTNDEVTIGVITDLGTACHHVIDNFKQCHAAFLEANYDDEMLEKGKYPFYLKKRISSDYGHLSNQQSLDLFKSHKPDFMSHLLLSHLSQDNNDPKLVLELFTRHAGDTHIAIASRHNESGVYCITGKANKNFNVSSEYNNCITKPVQMKLFDVISK